MIVFTEMDVAQLISALKPRSGKSLKFSVKQIIRKNLNSQNFCIVLLSNAGSKIAVIMRGNDVNNLRIEVSKNYLVKNLVHKENRSGVAVFKLSKSVFNFSGVVLDNTLDFSKSEVSDLEGINVLEYCADQSPNLEVASGSSVASNAGSLISLFEFCQLNPRDIKDNQFVEVIETTFLIKLIKLFSWLFWVDGLQQIDKLLLVDITN